jgi:hypothetical protein|tara:strand:- start:10 stop:396 length:387 start_codon:yes stop_codon:yes gene_type:complete
MKMPLSEILDRYTITKLKSERTNEDVSDELRTYKKEVDNPDYVERSNQIISFIDRLYEINGELWDTEGDIRKGVEMPLEEIGRLALKVRDLNCIRNEIKAEIVDTFAEGFKEIKINYKKIDYGRNEVN